MGRLIGTRARLLAFALLFLLGSACFPPALEQERDSDGSETGANDSDVADTAVADTELPDTNVTETETTDTTDIETDSSNACGGLGTLSPGGPGQPCGPCLDGELVCDPSDPTKNRTVCEGDTARNACNGCGPLEETLGADCGECGQVVCDGTTGTRCAEPANGCETPLTCLDLGCSNANRTCVESDGELDARCDACLETWVEVEGACLGQAPPPSEVTASTDLDDRVLVSWSASLHATAYRVFRCPGTCDEAGPWTELLGTAVTSTSLPDQTATAPSAPPAPTVIASSDRPDDVSVSWSAVTAPASPRFTYRVVAVAPAGESAPSPTAVGHLGERAITSYELKVANRPWQAAEGFAHTDTEAAAPTLTPGTVTATQGTFPDKVALSLSGWANTPGAERAYQVRARTRFGPGEEGGATGRRRAGPVTLTWERSAGSGPEDFAPISGSGGPIADATFDDTDSAGMPPLGVVRHYRARLEAEGANPVVSSPVAGWRTPLPGNPQIESVSTTLQDRVQVRWSRVDGAVAYHLYRDGQRVSPPEGYVCPTDPCTFEDTGATAPVPWDAPSGVVASTNRTSGVTISWTPPPAPSTTPHDYALSALNAAGETVRSPEVSGWRGFPELSGYEVKATATQVAVFPVESQLSSFDHDTAPLATFAPATLNASQGAHRAHVSLELEGGALAEAPSVTYEVRGVYPQGATAWSSSATGRRSVGSVTRTWEYSMNEAPEAWVTLPGTTCQSAATACVDDDASPLGVERRYRVTLDAPGAAPLSTQIVRGWRLAFTQVSGGLYAMCAIDTQGRLWTWGRYREVGGGNPDEYEWRGTLHPRVRDEGPFNRCAIGGSLEATGSNLIPLAFGCGFSASSPPRCGSFLDDTALVEMTSLGAGIRSLSIGGIAACAVVANGQARCWGEGFMLGDLQGQSTTDPVVVRLSVGDPLTDLAEISVGGGHACARGSDGRIWCWGENDFGESGLSAVGVQLHASQVPDLVGAASLSLGADHTCVQLLNEQVVCFGQNAYGQLGDGTETNRATPSPVLLSVSPSIPIEGVAELQSIGSTNCVRRSHEVRCWGHGWDGRLGDGTFDSVATLPRQVTGLGATSHIGGGGYTACAIVDGSIWCWGSGHLGDGTTTARATPGEVTLP